MKASKYLMSGMIAAMAVAMSGCNDDFMERYPKTSISPEAYFKSPRDLELYTNNFYNDLPSRMDDGPCDNYATYADSHSNNDVVRGTITPETVGRWGGWGTLRKYNMLLAHVDQVEGDQAETNHYVGMTRLMRAIWYYDKVKMYNDVPWYDVPLTDADEDLLYAGRDPRTKVVDNIMADLDFACNNMKEYIGNGTIMSRWFALAVKSRICLAEGTWRKYHDELKLTDSANRFFTEAAKAAKEVIDGKAFSISKAGGVNSAYINLFNTENLANNPEVILFFDYSYKDGIKNNLDYLYETIIGLSRSLMESYEYINPDGTTQPFCTVPDYDKMTFVEAFKNRDPRLAQTFCAPGYVKPGEATSHRMKMNLGGYHSVKYRPTEAQQTGWWNTALDVHIARYAEVLLNYAEAKAELGELTQNDMDISVNEIRSRVGLPAIKIDNLKNDPSLAADFPDVTDRKILEIRRERRIELANEGFRWDDLMRWKAGRLIREVQEGMYLKEYGVFDISGDGVPEMGVFESEATNNVPADSRANYTFYYTNSGYFSLSEGDHGFVVVSNEKGNRQFQEPRDYYYPLPLKQRILNPNLEETIFW